MTHDDQDISESDLRALLDDQRRAREIISLADAPAPTALRRRIDEMRHPVRRPRARLLAGGAAMAALAAVALVLLVVLPSDGLGPSVAQAAALAERPPSAPAPSERAEEPALLEGDVDGVAFPAWDAEFGWKAVGARSDEIDGRRARTVFYEKEGRRVVYTIVSGDPLSAPDTQAVVLTETVLRDVPIDPGSAITWERTGHTCVLSSARVPAEKLRELAVWRGAGAVEF